MDIVTATLVTVKATTHIGSMREVLDPFTAPRAELARAHPSGKLVCVACAHTCKLADGARGVCLVRRREHDTLQVPWGYVAGVAVDPIEKKPFFHVLPGSRALSFGMLGCNFHCAFCQNWVTSQTLRDSRSSSRLSRMDPASLVRAAVDNGCAAVTSTYNEPLISVEWARDIFALAREASLLTTVVSNGYGTPEVVDFLSPVLDAFKVDLKAFRHETYRALGGRLEPVKETIALLAKKGVWVEVVTLVVPGLNDTDAELDGIASFLASLSPDIPWHVTAFHPDYQMLEPPPTPIATLQRAAQHGRRAGLRFVYAGNIPGGVGDLEDTFCPRCRHRLVERHGFAVHRCLLDGNGRCPQCGATIAGRWRRGRTPR